MSKFFDILDSIGDFSEQARRQVVQTLAINASKYKAIRQRIEANPSHAVDILVQEANLDVFLTSMELADLKDRV